MSATTDPIIEQRIRAHADHMVHLVAVGPPPDARKAVAPLVHAIFGLHNLEGVMSIVADAIGMANEPGLAKHYDPDLVAAASERAREWHAYMVAAAVGECTLGEIGPSSLSMVGVVCSITGSGEPHGAMMGGTVQEVYRDGAG